MCILVLAGTGVHARGGAGLAWGLVWALPLLGVAEAGDLCGMMSLKQPVLAPRLGPDTRRINWVQGDRRETRSKAGV